MVGQEFTEVTFDKFTFRVMHGYLYHPGECWVREEGSRLVVGLTDYLQTSAGDVALVELPEPGQEVVAGQEVAVIETIKTTVRVQSPVSGTVVEVNTALEEDPQAINQDAYGQGWLFCVEPSRWEEERASLMDAQAYLPVMEAKIKADLGSR